MFLIIKPHYYFKLKKEVQEIICDVVNDFPDFTEIFFSFHFLRANQEVSWWKIELSL